MKVCPVCQREYPAGAANCTEDGVPLVAMVTDVYARSEALVGQIVEGRYKIERIIGKGGMGVVYACRHVVVGKVAAMKVLKAGVERSDGVLQRFVREAQTANLLKSRHIVEVSDFGQLPSGAFFVVMELLEGQDLARGMRNGLDRAQLVHIFLQVAETLQLAHDRGIVHRDLKPDNVFLVEDAGDPLFVKILDFGIAKILHGDAQDGRNSGLTETGVILGTPYYMSPEQARAEAIDHRSDIYALGVMMYRAFTGRLPFVADSTMGVLTRHITETPQPPSEVGNVDQVTERLILRCLAKKPEYRFQSMRELAEALRTVPLAPVPAIREQSTVFEGPRPPAPAPSGAYAQVPAGMPSGAYAQAAYATPSGAYAQTPPAAPSGAHAAMSGGYAPVSPTGAQRPMPTGGYAPAVGGVSGPYTPAPGAYPVVIGTTPAGPNTGTMTALHASGGPPPSFGPEPTTRGVAATSFPAAQRGTNPLLVIGAGLGMAAVGAVGAFFLLYHPPVAVPIPAAAPSAIAAPPPPSATASATTAPVTTTAPASAEPASAPVPAAASAAPRRGGPVGPRAAPPPPTTAPASPKIPRDIRSPFD